MLCHQCRQSASQFVYLDGEPTCYNCYNLVERAPSYQFDTTPVSDGLRELREWSGVSRDRWRTTSRQRRRCLVHPVVDQKRPARRATLKKS